MVTDERRGTVGRERGGTVASAFAPLLDTVFAGPPPVRFEFWDGSGVGARSDGDAGGAGAGAAASPGGGTGGDPALDPGSGNAIRIRSKDALRRLIWSPGELGLGRAFVAGELDLDGDVFAVLGALRDAAANNPDLGPGVAVSALRVAARMGTLGRPLPPPPEEARPRGRRHSKHRDSDAISHHYDVGNDFYRLFLGPSMTYSCARFVDPANTLEQAQSDKCELISRKLGLQDRPGQRLLDIGCGWGTMALHAAAKHGAQVVGVTISREQADAARERVAAAGLSDQVEIRLQDYRDLSGETFDAVSSIGMFEHVGTARVAEYFTTIKSLLRPQGRLLNHAISSIGGSVMSPRSFIARYVFPDGELIDVGEVVLAMERAGFEVRDVESLREHYALTLRAWVRNLESQWSEAVALVGEPRARIWRLYMAASALGFEDGGIGIHQVLGVVPDKAGGSGMPRTRVDWK
ncbi:MAG TPA: cyclopropane-fatty-acyl-phospholipid synthase family protein [Actinocrinis sp.]|nr:cyclopropane-fatty-acyl-phospholipid synthase family protein [Actinocrinis sp.]